MAVKKKRRAGKKLNEKESKGTIYRIKLRVGCLGKNQDGQTLSQAN